MCPPHAEQNLLNFALIYNVVNINIQPKGPKAFLLNFPQGAIHILSSPKWKGHPIYSKPFWRLTYCQCLYRRTLSLAHSCCLSSVFWRSFKFTALHIEEALISRTEERIALGADHPFSEEKNSSMGGENAHCPTGVSTVSGVSRARVWGQFNSTSHVSSF